MDLPYQFSTCLFCCKCGNIWGRIAVGEHDWVVEHSLCIHHRSPRRTSDLSKPETFEPLYKTRPSVHNHAIFGIRFRNMPKQILARDFLVLYDYFHRAFAGDNPGE